jgi:hypothetical protein
MSSARLWKSVAGAAGAFALVLGGAGIAGASTPASTGVRSPHTISSESPTPDCHSAEHAGLGMIINCQSEKKPGSS